MSSIIAEIFKDEIAEAAQKAKEEGKAEEKEKTLIENIRSLMKKLILQHNKLWMLLKYRQMSKKST